MVVWCNSFIIAPKVNVTVCFCLDPARLNQALIKLVHRGPTLYDILFKLTNVSYTTIIDASSGYHSLKLKKKCTYLPTFPCQFGRFRFTRLPFKVMPAGDIFQQKIDDIFTDLPNAFCVSEDILIVGMILMAEITTEP